MNVRPIRNDQDHRKALARIEALMSAGPGTAAGNELDVLATLVESYEQRHFPIEPADLVENCRSG